MLARGAVVVRGHVRNKLSNSSAGIAAPRRRANAIPWIICVGGCGRMTQSPDLLCYLFRLPFKAGQERTVRLISSHVRQG